MNATLDTAPEALRRRFETVRPRLEAHGRVQFRHLRCPHRRDDAQAEMLALCWAWFVRLARRGKDASAFASALAGYAARAVRSGRRLCGQERAKDVLSPWTAWRHGFAVGTLPEGGAAFEEALRDNTQTPVPDQVGFRLDFPAWLGSLGERDRRLALELMAGERTQDAAARFGLSPARVSQMRRQFMEGWGHFHGESAGNPGLAAPSTHDAP